MKIAEQYGISLSGGDRARVERLIRNYPSHSFVIDYEEAKGIFKNVREPKSAETEFEIALRQLEKAEGTTVISAPSPVSLIGCLNPKLAEEGNDNDKTDTGETAKRAEVRASQPIGSNGSVKTPRAALRRNGARQGKNGRRAKTTKVNTR